MKRRPWPIVILAFFQIFLEPFNNLLVNSWLSGVSPRVYVDYFVENRDWLTLFYLFLLPPIMGISAYAMKKWSYAVFVAGATWMLFHNFNLVNEGSIRLSYAIAMYIGNVGFVTYFLLPKVHAPYMNPKLRWWESKTRFLVDWPCRVVSPGQNAKSCRIQDFSEGGVFLVCNEPLPTNQVFELRMSPLDSGEILAIRGKCVFSRPVQGNLGHGFQFVDVDRQTATRLLKLSKNLKKTGIPFRNGQDSSWVAFKIWATRLFTTGQGLLPETDRAAAAGASHATEKPSEKSAESKAQATARTG